MTEPSSTPLESVAADVLAAFRLLHGDLGDLTAAAAALIDDERVRRYDDSLHLAIVPTVLLDALAEVLDRISGEPQ